MTSAWTLKDIPDQTGRLAVVTGATGGLGYETALTLAGAKARVILTGRNAAKGWNAVNRICAIHPQADVRFEILDLASLASVEAFTSKMLAAGHPLHLLVNNAGVMALPTREVTIDSFEMQLATNYLGHFALTARLLPLLTRGRQSRVVSLSSIAHRKGAIDLGDLQGKDYQPWRAYAQSGLGAHRAVRQWPQHSQGLGLAARRGHAGRSLFQPLGRGRCLADALCGHRARRQAGDTVWTRPLGGYEGSAGRRKVFAGRARGLFVGRRGRYASKELCKRIETVPPKKVNAFALRLGHIRCLEHSAQRGGRDHDILPEPAGPIF